MFLTRSVCSGTIFLFCLVAVIAASKDVPGRGRIINGRMTTIEDVPYMVMLRDANRGGSYCGGTLVTPKFVVTAAHCFLNRQPENVRVIGGASTVSEAGVERGIAKLTVHPEYSLSTLHMDIAILELDDIMSGPYIVPIPLCQQPLKAGELVQISGWGHTEEKQKSVQLRTVRLPVATREICDGQFGPFVQENMFCLAGVDKKGSCFGDSDGPAVYRGQLCGIAAIAIKCEDGGHPGAYTDVYALRSYIESVVRG